MRGTEKQIEYANQLRDLAVEAYDNTIAAEIADNDLTPEDSYIAKLQGERDTIAAFNGEAGQFINIFRTMGHEANGRVARSCYKKFAPFVKMGCEWTK